MAGQQGMREYRKGQAKSFFLEHPEASIAECVAAFHAKSQNMSERTAAQARSELAQKGLVPQGRNAKTAAKLTQYVAPVPMVPAGSVTPPFSTSPPIIVKDTILDDKTLQAAAEGDLLDIFDLDDEEIRKKLLRGVIRIALRPGTHPDTQLSATTVWAKLKDMARVSELGPGRPMTRAIAVSRLKDLMIAVGSEIALEAMYSAFNVKEAANGEAPVDEAVAPVEPTEDSISLGHDDSPPQVEDVRPLDMGTSLGGSTDPQHEDRSGPTP